MQAPVSENIEYQLGPGISASIGTSRVIPSCAQVIAFWPDGSVEQAVQTSETLGLAPRDVSLFAPRPAGLSSQRATITPREDALLVRTEIAAAIVKRDAAYVFPCRCAPLHTLFTSAVP